MGSLEKVTTAEALAKWADDVRKRLGTDEPVAYVVEPKIDGSAVSLVYEHGVYVRGETRGDGLRGEDVTQLSSIRAAAHAPLRARLRVALEVRGEIYPSGFARSTRRRSPGRSRAEPTQRGAGRPPAQSGDHFRAPVAVRTDRVLRGLSQGERASPAASATIEPAR
jgi:hypothetical protein